MARIPSREVVHKVTSRVPALQAANKSVRQSPAFHRVYRPSDKPVLEMGSEISRMMLSLWRGKS